MSIAALSLIAKMGETPSVRQHDKLETHTMEYDPAKRELEHRHIRTQGESQRK